MFDTPGAFTPAPSPPDPDALEDNDRPSQTAPLGIINGWRVIGQLSVQTRDEDWFSFTLSHKGISGEHLQIDFEHDLGDLDIDLWSNTGVYLDGSDLSGDFERIDLAGWQPGAYFLRVYGAADVLPRTNPDYTLTFVTVPKGTARNDHLTGGAGNEILAGLARADIIEAGGGYSCASSRRRHHLNAGIGHRDKPPPRGYMSRLPEPGE